VQWEESMMRCKHLKNAEVCIFTRDLISDKPTESRSLRPGRLVEVGGVRFGTMTPPPHFSSSHECTVTDAYWRKVVCAACIVLEKRDGSPNSWKSRKGSWLRLSMITRRVSMVAMDCTSSSNRTPPSLAHRHQCYEIWNMMHVMRQVFTGAETVYDRTFGPVCTLCEGI